MPERLPYDEAMLFASARLKIADPELKQGQVEKVTIQTKVGPVVRPWGIEGGFAVVYKFRIKSGQLRALRCFRVPMKPDTQFRYERIGPYFQAHARDITATFKYHDTGILVKEQGKQSQTYPVIEMDWIDGVTLLEKVDELCKIRERTALKNLREQWLSILKTMQSAQIAHGDLAGLNVMVKANGQMVLVDYDGVYIPDFAGLPQIVLGQIDYQHPQMNQRPFNEHMDDFSALVIYTALLALEVQPELWHKYVKRNPQGKLLDTNLLFTQQDFKDPGRSPLMRELEQSGDQRIVAAVQELRRLSLQPIDQARFPFKLIDPDYEKKLALEQLKQALKASDDELIVARWSSILDSYPPAQSYRSRVQEAKNRVKALQRFRRAIQGHTIQQIIDNYDAILDACNNVTRDERLLLDTARRFIQAYRAGNDDDLLAMVEAFHNTPTLKGVVYTAQEQQSISLARQRKIALQQLRDALTSRSVDAIATAYQPGQNTYTSLSNDERQQAEMALAFVQAYQTDEDATILTAYDAVQNSRYHDFFIFTAQQQQRIALARQRIEALVIFRVALASRIPRRIVSAYKPVLDTSKHITQDQRHQFALANSFIHAYDSDDDFSLVAAYDNIQASIHRTFFTFTTEERQRIDLAKKRNEALVKFRDALANKRPGEIVAAYDLILDNSKYITQDERYRLTLARDFIQAYAREDDEALVAIANAIENRNIFMFTIQEQERISLAIRRQAALIAFQKAWRGSLRNAQKLVDAYDAFLLDTSKKVTSEQRARVEAARNYLKMLKDIRAGISADNDDLILNVYNKALDQEFEGFSAAERDRVNRIIKSLELQELLHNREDERAILMARNVARTYEKAIQNNMFQLHLATKRFIRLYDLSGLQVHITEDRAKGNNEAVAHWRWPHNDLVKDGLLAWRTDTWPQRPQERSWQDSEWHWVEVHRKSNQSDGECRFSIGTQTHIYVQAFACIRDDWDQEHMTLRYSDGIEPTSRTEAAISRMVWHNYG